MDNPLRFSLSIFGAWKPIRNKRSLSMEVLFDKFKSFSFGPKYLVYIQSIILVVINTNSLKTKRTSIGLSIKLTYYNTYEIIPTESVSQIPRQNKILVVV